MIDNAMPVSYLRHHGETRSRALLKLSLSLSTQVDSRSSDNDDPETNRGSTECLSRQGVALRTNYPSLHYQSPWGPPEIYMFANSQNNRL